MYNDNVQFLEKKICDMNNSVSLLSRFIKLIDKTIFDVHVVHNSYKNITRNSVLLYQSIVRFIPLFLFSWHLARNFNPNTFERNKIKNK